MMHRVFIGLGANLGAPVEQIVSAIQAFSAHEAIRVVAISSLYQSKPMDVAEPQPDYLNAVVEIKTTLAPHDLLLLGQTLERNAGSMKDKKKQARRLDIDWLLVDEDVVNEPELKIPHPALTKRAFVLVPLCEIAPAVRHPIVGETIAVLKAAISVEGVQKISVGNSWASADKE